APPPAWCLGRITAPWKSQDCNCKSEVFAHYFFRSATLALVDRVTGGRIEIRRLVASSETMQKIDPFAHLFNSQIASWILRESLPGRRKKGQFFGNIFRRAFACSGRSRNCTSEISLRQSYPAARGNVRRRFGAQRRVIECR